MSYWARWRAAHPVYRAREALRQRVRRSQGERGDRGAEYARRNEARRLGRSGAPEPLGLLFPDLRHGAVLEFWGEALAADLRQERALAELEGVDPDAAVRRYAQRERVWHRLTVSLEEGRGSGRGSGQT